MELVGGGSVINGVTPSRLVTFTSLTITSLTVTNVTTRRVPICIGIFQFPVSPLKCSADLYLSVWGLLMTSAVAWGASAACLLLGRDDSESPLWGESVALHWRTFLMTLLILVVTPAAIGLVHWGLVNACDCCVVGNSCTNTRRLHAQALLLLVLPQK